VLLAGVALIGVLFRWLMLNMDTRLQESKERESRLADRVTKLEAFIEGTLVDLVKNCMSAITANTEASCNLVKRLDDNPCLLSSERQAFIVDQLAMRMEKTIQQE
jgi:hypothetical protein